MDRTNIVFRVQTRMDNHVEIVVFNGALECSVYDF